MMRYNRFQPAGICLKTVAIVLVLCCRETALANGVEDNCAMCHDKAPVSSEHMAVESLSVEECLLCHAAEADDPFFSTVHRVHAAGGLECDSCHGDGADPERQQRLDRLLGD